MKKCILCNSTIRQTCRPTVRTTTHTHTCVCVCVSVLRPASHECPLCRVLVSCVLCARGFVCILDFFCFPLAQFSFELDSQSAASATPHIPPSHLLSLPSTTVTSRPLSPAPAPAAAFHTPAAALFSCVEGHFAPWRCLVLLTKFNTYCAFYWLLLVIVVAAVAVVVAAVAVA